MNIIFFNSYNPVKIHSIANLLMKKLKLRQLKKDFSVEVLIGVKQVQMEISSSHVGGSQQKLRNV
jgi:hypothetical protein